MNRSIYRSCFISCIAAWVLIGTMFASSGNQNVVDETKANSKATRLTDEQVKVFAAVSERRRTDPVLRLSAHKDMVDEYYKAIVDDFDISDAAKKKIMQLIVQRYEDKSVAIDVSERNHERSDTLINKAVDASTATSDQEVKALVDKKTFDLYQQMIQVGYYLSVISSNYAKTLTLAGCPLTGKQRLALATAMREFLDPEINAKALSRKDLPLNAAGLTELEEGLITKLQAELSDKQLFIVRNDLVNEERLIRR